MRSPDNGFSKVRSRLWFAILIGSGLLGVIVWAAMAPVTSASSDEIFEIPKGTWARRMAGNNVDILPAKIHLTLGIRNILVLKNMDDVPQVFGPALMMPGQTFRLPFEVASSYQFACTAHASGQMTVVVAPMPTSPWARLEWRLNALLTAAQSR